MTTYAETLPRGGAESLGEEDWRRLLEEARRRTLALVDPVSESDMDRVHDPLMSPLVWDLGHIAAFEDLWLVQRAGGLEPARAGLWEIYDASETPRRERGNLPYLRTAEVKEYMAEVRGRALAVLAKSDLSEHEGSLSSGGFVWDMLLQHEHQHNETMLQTLQLAAAGTYAPRRRELPAAPAYWVGGMIHVPEGRFLMGAAAGPFAYDNERPQHEVDVPRFAIDRTPVTSGAFAEFIDDGGYARRELWSEDGWDWRRAEAVERPRYWTADGRVRSYDRIEPFDPALPVMCVSWYEADAYARYRDKRLPTEAEWEKAAAWDPFTNTARRYPWGDDPPTPERANLDQTAFGAAPAGALPAGASAYGALGMLGDVWEWTASPLTAYPGYVAYPYREYSEVFFGGTYRVLRGGSWATRPRVIRNSFRNWDLPERRQIFAGFRCAA